MSCGCAERREIIRNVATGRTTLAEGARQVAATVTPSGLARVQRSLARRAA